MAAWKLPNSPSDMLALSIVDLACLILDHLNELTEEERDWNAFSRKSCANHYGDDRRGTLHNDAKHAFLEAWNWLETHGLIVRDVDHDFYFVSRVGRQVKSKGDLTNAVNSRMLPQSLLHKSLAGTVWQTFLRGEYDTAVFSAFKAVEIAVRSAANLTNADIGVPLMRKAFASGTGALTNRAALPAEQEALCHLFAGAAGYFRNPSAHQIVPINEPTEAIEMIMFANHLLRIVDERK